MGLKQPGWGNITYRPASEWYPKIRSPICYSCPGQGQRDIRGSWCSKLTKK